MIKAIVIGAAGRMGGRIISLLKEDKDFSLTGATEKRGHPSLGQDAGDISGGGKLGVSVTDDLEKIIENGDVVIDFTSPMWTLVNIRAAVRHKKAMVIGTTGFSKQETDEIERFAKEIPCVVSPNMSVGVNLLFKVIADMASVLKDDYDVEILEAHHNQKKDAPSGTAIKMAEIIAHTLQRTLDFSVVYSRHGQTAERKKKEIGIQCIRAGDIVGDHTVIFGGMGERIEVTHRAHNRDTFARGALLATKWVVTQPPGLYDMMDVLGLRKHPS